MRRLLTPTLACLAAAGLTVGTAGPAAASFQDVPGRHWAAGAIAYVAEQHDWMRDYGEGEFRPNARLTRRHLARALVRAFAPKEVPDPAIAFFDLDPQDRFHPFAAVAVARGWMTAPGGAFEPTGRVAKVALDRALVRALGLTAEIRGLSRMTTEDGTRLRRPSGFAEMVLAQELGLHYNHPVGDGERRELLPTTAVRRADAAQALYRAASAAGTWRVTSLERYRRIVLPNMTEDQQAAIEFAMRYAGYPYIYAAEWFRETPDGYCCGTQPQGGFDCSGYVWWVMRKPGSGYDNSAFRPYRGWDLPERSSREMARSAPVRVRYGDLRPMDLMFFDGDASSADWEGVDHVGLYMGRGWMIHSSGGNTGVTVEWAREGWWRDHFKWGRRLIPS